MADIRKVVKVFLASPGDLADERKAAKSVVDEHNDLMADDFGYQVELIGWEDTIAAFGRPQAIINRDLDRCELFIGLMWKRWGTFPDASGPYTSGFEEEFGRSVERQSNEGRPEISLFFKNIDQEFLRDPGTDLIKVLAFKERLITEKKIYFECFANIVEFQTKIRRCIYRYVKQLRERDVNEVSIKNQGPTTGGERQQASDATNSPADTPLSVEGAKFLREFISKTERSGDEEQFGAVEVARFRLLAGLVGKQGNDSRSLGVHDANLIFAADGEFSFGHQELTALVTAGLRNFPDENVPLWRWFVAIEGFERQLLPIYSLVGSDTKRRVGALAAMRLLAEPVQKADRDECLDSWFSEESATEIKIAALRYLTDCGIASDLTIIRKEFDRADNKTLAAAAEAIIRISLRESRDKGISALYELQPTSIARDLLEALFANESSLNTETLASGLEHHNANVRRIVTKLLRARHALAPGLAEQLLTDSDAVVRYEALMSLVDVGRPFSEEHAKRILVTPDQARGPGFGAALGLLGAPSFVAQRCFDQFCEMSLRLLKDRELEDAAMGASIYDQTAEFILAERHFNLRGDELRRRIADQYKEVYSRKLDEMVAKYGTGQADVTEKTRSLEDYMRKKLTRKALDIICRKGEPIDLALVRSTLRSDFVDYSANDIDYLWKFGEWEDIPLIVESVERPDFTRTESIIWSESTDSRYRAAARAIHKIGKNRLSGILTMSIPDRLLCHLIAESPDKDFRNLDDVSVTVLLQSKSDVVRKVSALKCIRALSKRRVAKLLATYVSKNQTYYYNVAHWLDFGVSTPRNRARIAADSVLTKEWRS